MSQFIKTIRSLGLVTITSFFVSPSSFGQSVKPTAAARPSQLVRTTSKSESIRFGYGGTLTIVGAPEGAISVEGWSRNELQVSAEIELRADNEADLDRLAAVNSFVIDEDLNHVRILTTGTHDRAFMKARAKNFPKKLLSLPWKVAYRIRVPVATDLEINAGRGPITLAGVEGHVRVSAPESETSLKLSGGTLSVTVGAGNVTLAVPARSWRGAGADIRVAAGVISLELPAEFSADVDADILRVGEIANTYEGLQSREKPGVTKQLVRGRIGAGGAFFKLTVGDGRIFIKKQ